MNKKKATKKSNKKVVKLIDKVNPKLQVVPEDVLNFVLSKLDDAPAKYSFQILEVLKVHVQQGHIVPIKDYLEAVDKQKVEETDDKG